MVQGVDMNTIVSQNMTSVVLVVFSVASGIFLGLLGKPLNDLIFALHKIVAVGAVIVLAVRVVNLYKAGGIHALHVASFSLTGLFFVALIVSGALLSLVYGSLLTLDDQTLQATLRVHQIVPVLVLVSSAVSIYLLNSGEVLLAKVAAR